MRVWLYFLGTALSVALPFFYYLFFHGLFLSSEQIDWGSFGSYMSGIAGPLVSGVTLAFMLISFQYQARTGATTIFFSMVTAHLESMGSYQTEYSCDVKGYEYLQWIWRNFHEQVANESNNEVKNKAMANNAPELLPMVNSILVIFRFLDNDRNLDSKIKEQYFDYFWSRISAVEKKLFLAMAIYDEVGSDVIPLLKKYRKTIRCRISAPTSEENFIEKLKESILI